MIPLLVAVTLVSLFCSFRALYKFAYCIPLIEYANWVVSIGADMRQSPITTSVDESPSRNYFSGNTKIAYTSRVICRFLIILSAPYPSPKLMISIFILLGRNFCNDLLFLFPHFIFARPFHFLLRSLYIFISIVNL